MDVQLIQLWMGVFFTGLRWMSLCSESQQLMEKKVGLPRWRPAVLGLPLHPRSCENCIQPIPSGSSKAVSGVLFIAQAKLLESEVMMKTSYSWTKAGWRRQIQATHSDSGQQKVGRCQLFSCETGGKKKGISARDGGVQARGTAAEKDIMADRRRNTSIRVSCDASPLYPFQEKKKGRGGWWMAPLAGEEQSSVSPEGPRGENDYFLAKWFWLELHLNHVGDGTLNQYSNTGATLWLNSFKVTLLTLSRPDFLDLVRLSHPGPSHYTRTLILTAANVIMCDVSTCFCNFKTYLGW